MAWIEYIPNFILPYIGFLIFMYSRWSKWSNAIDKAEDLELFEGPKTFSEWVHDQRQEIGWALILATLISSGEESTIDSLVDLLIKIFGSDWEDTFISIQVNSQKLLFVFFGACSTWIVEKLGNRFKKKP
jgi:hypothetical protein